MTESNKNDLFCDFPPLIMLFACLPNVLDGGFIYIQNAQPNGPSVWIFLEATDRLMRHADDDWKWMSSLGLSKGCKFMDQDMLNEVLGSVVSGRPIWKDTLWACAVNRTNPQGLLLMQRHEAVGKYINWGKKCQVRGKHSAEEGLIL